MIIRNRSPSDGAALEAIASETHQLDGYPVYLPDDLKSFVMDEGALGAWVAATGAEVLGHVALHRTSAVEVMKMVLATTGLAEDSIVFVARLLVAPTARRRGVGRALLEKATQEAGSLGRRAFLDVVRDHRAAIALYEECGWRSIGSVDWTLPGDLPLRELVYISPDWISGPFRE